MLPLHKQSNIDMSMDMDIDIDPRLEAYLVGQVTNEPVERTSDIAAMIVATGYTEEQLVSAIEFDPDLDGAGESRGVFFFNPDNLPNLA